MRVFPCCMGEGEYFAGRGPHSRQVWSPFRIRNKGRLRIQLSLFFRNKNRLQPGNGLEPWFLTAAPANYRFDCPRAIFFTLRLAEPRA